VAAARRGARARARQRQSAAAALDRSAEGRRAARAQGWWRAAAPPQGVGRAGGRSGRGVSLLEASDSEVARSEPRRKRAARTGQWQTGCQGRAASAWGRAAGEPLTLKVS